MQEDEANPAEQQVGRGLPALPAMVAYERPRRDIGFHFVDQVAREAKSVAGIETITANSYTVRSTINPQLQRAVETTLQEGLSRYERSAGRVQFVSPEAKLGKAVQRAEAERKAGDKRPAWQHGARERAIAALRRALDVRDRVGKADWARKARLGGSVWLTAASCRSPSTTPPRSASLRSTTWCWCA